MKFSIVTPSFNQLDHLKRCVASVADQAGSFELEHLIHEGGSGAEFEKWSLGQDSASVVMEKDKGMYDAINRGFLRSSGDILAWLNCDEQYLPGSLDAVARWFTSHPHKDILFGDVVIVSAEGIPLSYRKAISPLKGHIRNCFLSTYSAATFIRRSILNDGNLLDINKIAIADAIWIHALLKKGYSCGVLNIPLSIFLQTGENLGQSASAIKEAEDWRGNRPLQRKFWGGFHRLRKFLAGCYSQKSVHLDLYLASFPDRQVREAQVGEVWKTK